LRISSRRAKRADSDSDDDDEDEEEDEEEEKPRRKPPKAAPKDIAALSAKAAKAGADELEDFAFSSEDDE
jgi:hypothetical protein